MQLSEIWRFPVKSMQGERLESASVGPYGIEGDRAWSLFDAEPGLNLTGRRDPDLLFAAARLAGEDVIITLPDGTETDDDEALSAWLGRPVELRRAPVDGTGTYEIKLDETDDGSWFQWKGPAGSYHDSAGVSLASVDAFRHWDKRRFRTNLILDRPGDTDLIGHRATVGAAELEVVKPIDRCIMVTRPQPAVETMAALDRDLDVLKTINRELESRLAVGAVVVESGTIAVGDEIRPQPG